MAGLASSFLIPPLSSKILDLASSWLPASSLRSLWFRDEAMSRASSAPSLLTVLWSAMARLSSFSPRSFAFGSSLRPILTTLSVSATTASSSRSPLVTVLTLRLRSLSSLSRDLSGSLRRARVTRLSNLPFSVILSEERLAPGTMMAELTARFRASAASRFLSSSSAFSRSAFSARILDARSCVLALAFDAAACWRTA